jgi:hypothetical protein
LLERIGTPNASVPPTSRMIAKLRGLLDGFTADHAVVDVNGVGYLVGTSATGSGF